MPVGAQSHTEATSVIIDWLTSPAFPDPHTEIRTLTRHLDTLHEPGVTRAQFHRCIELFYSRALQLSGEARRELRSLQLPLSKEWQDSASQLIGSLLRIAEG